MLELSILEIGLFLTTGMIAGLLAGLLGVGGGLFIVPVLLFLLPVIGIESIQLMTICVATSLCTIVITSASSVVAHQKHRAILWPIFWRLFPGIILGALIGAFTADIVSQQLLRNLFGVSVILIALKMLFQFQPSNASKMPGRTGLIGSGTLIGCVSAMIGIGGGALTVPALSYWKIPMSHSVATSAACGLPLAIAGTIGFIFFLVKKVNSGSGLDHYISMAGYDLSYLQALMMFGSMPFVVILAEIASHYLGKDERDFIKKYDIKDE